MLGLDLHSQQSQVSVFLILLLNGKKPTTRAASAGLPQAPNAQDSVAGLTGHVTEMP